MPQLSQYGQLALSSDGDVARVREQVALEDFARYIGPLILVRGLVGHYRSLASSAEHGPNTI